MPFDEEKVQASGVMGDKAAAPLPMRGKLVLRGTVRLLTPFVLLFGLYVQLHGDYGPGGGFQAGVIFATGLVLFGLIFGPELAERVFPPIWTERLLALGVLIYGAVGVYSFFAVGPEAPYNFLDYDAIGKQGQHYGIVLVELGVGLAVACAMVRLYYAFADLSVLPAHAEEAFDDESPLRERHRLERASRREKAEARGARSSFGGRGGKDEP